MDELLRRWRYPALAAVLFLVLLTVVLARQARSPGPRSTPRAAFSLFWRPMVMGFYENQGTGSGTSWGSLVAHAQQIQITSPYWYRIDATGRLTNDMAVPQVTAFAHKHRSFVWPLIGNSGTDPMYSSTTRSQMAATIESLVQRHGYDGVLIDFELLAPYSRDDLSTFLNDLGKSLHRQGKGLGVAVFPKVGISKDVSYPYDYPALGTVTDAVVIMAYDHHYQGGPAGPVAPLPWVRNNVNFALGHVRSARIYLGVAAYGYDWTSSGQTNTVTTLQAQALLKKYGIAPTWDVASQEYHFHYVDGGQRHDIWYEDQRSFAQKLALAKASRLGGIALWELGGESPDIWTQLRHTSVF